MMLRLAPFSVSPNKVVVELPNPSWTRIPTLAAPRHLLVTRKAPNFISLCCSNVDTNNSILASKPLQSKSRTLPEAADDFPFERIEGDMMIKELNREEIHATIAMPKTIIKEEDESNGGDFPPEGVLLAVKISKRNGISVSFGVTLRPHRMKVFTFRVKKSLGLRELTIEMEEKMPEKLESGIQEYLKVRGMKPSYAEPLCRYMVNMYMKLKSGGL